MFCGRQNGLSDLLQAFYSTLRSSTILVHTLQKSKQSFQTSTSHLHASRKAKRTPWFFTSLIHALRKSKPMHTLRNKVLETHQIWCAFTVPPGTPDVMFMAHHMMVSSTHHTVVSAHQIWSASTVPQRTPDMVLIAHLEYCVQNGRGWSALHTHYGVCCTLDVGLHTIQQSVLWTLQRMLCTPGIYNKYSVQCPQKTCITIQQSMFWTLQ